jgi:hypothetical protein
VERPRLDDRRHLSALWLWQARRGRKASKRCLSASGRAASAERPTSYHPARTTRCDSAVERAYREITGFEPEFLFSGWGGSLTKGERKVVEAGKRASE